MKECVSLYSEFKSLSPMYTFEFWLETISKSSLQTCAPALNEYLSEEQQTKKLSEKRSDNERQDVNNDIHASSIRSLRSTEVGLWMDTMADWIWRDKYPSNSSNV